MREDNKIGNVDELTDEWMERSEGGRDGRMDGWTSRPREFEEITKKINRTEWKIVTSTVDLSDKENCVHHIFIPILER